MARRVREARRALELFTMFDVSRHYYQATHCHAGQGMVDSRCHTLINSHARHIADAPALRYDDIAEEYVID